MVEEIRATIRQIPRGKVATYGQVALAAGFPGYHRQVARVLRTTQGLPWQRVVGAGGVLKTQMESKWEQRFLLEAEGVQFRGRRIPMDRFGHQFMPWAASTASSNE